MQDPVLSYAQRTPRRLRFSWTTLICGVVTSLILSAFMATVVPPMMDVYSSHAASVLPQPTAYFLSIGRFLTGRGLPLMLAVSVGLGFLAPPVAAMLGPRKPATLERLVMRLTAAAAVMVACTIVITFAAFVVFAPLIKIGSAISTQRP